MKGFVWGIAAASLGLFLAAGAALAQSVSGSCAGSYDANGNFVSGAAGGCDASPQQASPSSGSGGVTPGQQMQLDAAYSVGSAIGSAFANWLFAPPQHHDAQRAIQQARQRMFIEKQRQENERFRQRQEHLQTLGDMKAMPSEATGDLELKDEGNAGSPNFQVTLAERRTIESLKNQVRTIDCGMAEAYEIAESLGPEGKTFAAELAEGVLAAERTLPQVPSGGAPDAVESMSFSLDSMNEGLHGPNGEQLIVKALVTRFPATGQARVDIQYHFLIQGKQAKEGQDMVALNSAGTVDCEDVTPATANCLKQAKLAGGIFSGKRYCPRPPPEKAEHEPRVRQPDRR